MTIVDYFLREKNMQLNASKESKMLININNPISVLVKEDKNFNTKDFVKKYFLNICNQNQEVIAAFSISYQFKLQFEKNEDYHENIFFDLIYPILYNSISSMMSEFDLPKLSIQSFYELSIQQK